MLERANPRRKKEGAIYSPAINVTVGAGKHDRNFRYKFEPEIPVAWLTPGVLLRSSREIGNSGSPEISG